MCFCDIDYDAPSVFDERLVVARKAHRCDECGEPIAKGDLYQYAFGVWDGNAKSYRTCDTCQTLVNLARSLHDDEPFCYFFGALHEALQECFSDILDPVDDEQEAA